MSVGLAAESLPSEEQLHDEIFSALEDMSSFLIDLKIASLSERHERERTRLEVMIARLRLKIAEHVHASQRINGVKSPRPVRKKSPTRRPLVKDSMFSFSAHLQKLGETQERKKSLSPEILRRASYSPEAKRRLEVIKPKIRPRSISCPEIKYTAPHGWKTSLPKVPENEELNEDEVP